MDEGKIITEIENVLCVMADVSVQIKRINGWIPSSATNVIVNGLKGSKPNHTTIGTNVLCRLTLKRALRYDSEQ